MKAIAQTFLIAAALIHAGCARPDTGRSIDYTQRSSEQSRRLIAVEEFEVVGEASRYGAPASWAGVELAQYLVVFLRKEGQAAVAVERGQELGEEPALRVRGRITRLDGGSSTARFWASGYGAGKATLAVAGEVVDGSGGVVGRFSDEERTSHPRARIHAIQYCVSQVAMRVATMVAEDDFRIRSADALRTDEEHLDAEVKQLRELRDGGYLSDEEFEELERKARGVQK